MFKFRYIVTFTALVLAGCAAYFSVSGLSQLFAGAGISIVIMASALEFTKIITASLLERYWGLLTKTLKVYLTIAMVILVSITSAGIYGLLSNGYKQTAGKLDIHDGELKIIESKKEFYNIKISKNEETISKKRDRVNTLNNFMITQESRLDSLDTKADWGSRSKAKIIRQDIKRYNEEIRNTEIEIDSISRLNNNALDSISNLDILILEKEANNDVGAELGPLIYLAELTNSDMDTVIGYFILAIIIIFDPLAITLIVVANKLSLMDVKKSEVITNENKIIEPIVEESSIEENENTLEVTNEEVVEEKVEDKKPSVIDDIISDYSSEYDKKNNTVNNNSNTTVINNGLPKNDIITTPRSLKPNKVVGRIP